MQEQGITITTQAKVQGAMANLVKQGLQTSIGDRGKAQIKGKTAVKPFANSVVHLCTAMTREVQKLAPACTCSPSAAAHPTSRASTKAKHNTRCRTQTSLWQST